MAEEIKKETKAPAKKAAPKKEVAPKVAAPKKEVVAEKEAAPKKKVAAKKESAPKKEVAPKAKATKKEEAVKKEAAPKKEPTTKAATKKEPVAKKEVVVDKKSVVKKEAAPKKEVAPKAATPKKEPAPKKEVAPKKKATVKKDPAPKAAAPAKAKPAASKVVKGHKKAIVANRLQLKYKNEVAPKLLEKFGYSSPMQIPALSKIVINVGVGDATQDGKKLEQAVNELALLSSQKPIITKAKKSIASFKLRAGQEIGCKVTLRGIRMYDFFDKLVTISLPRVRDFRGANKNAFDGRGNYTLGIREQLIFPEIDYDKVIKVRGMDVVIVTTAPNDIEAYALLELLGMPFQR